jgi:hypothetical protein
MLLTFWYAFGNGVEINNRMPFTCGCNSSLVFLATHVCPLTTASIAKALVFYTAKASILACFTVKRLPTGCW